MFELLAEDKIIMFELMAEDYADFQARHNMDGHFMSITEGSCIKIRITL
jgi:hypothetical protein